MQSENNGRWEIGKELKLPRRSGVKLEPDTCVCTSGVGRPKYMNLTQRRSNRPKLDYLPVGDPGFLVPSISVETSEPTIAMDELRVNVVAAHTHTPDAE
jgi:hypothetical protein